MYRSIAKLFSKAVRIGRTGIRLGFSTVSWKMLLRAIGSRVRTRAAVQPSGALANKGEERRNLSTRMLFLLGDFRSAMDQALSDLESRPDDVETRMLVVGCAIELGDFEVAEHHLSIVDARRIPDGLSEQLPFFRYTLARGRRLDDPQPAVRHLDALYLAMGCRPVRMDRTGDHGAFDSLTTVATGTPHCRDAYPPLDDGPLVSVVMKAAMLRRLGFFDSVRAEGGGEFESLIKILFGEHRGVNFPWPLCFGRVRSGSITANEEFGLIRGRGRPVREECRKACRKWHAEIGNGHEGYMPFPIRERPFAAPGTILADAGCTEAA